MRQGLNNIRLLLRSKALRGVCQQGNPAKGNLQPNTLIICHLETKAATRKIGNVKM